MKKALALLLALTMLLTLAGCSGSGRGSGSLDTRPAPDLPRTPSRSTAPTEPEPTEPDTEPTATRPTFTGSGDEVVLLDQDGVVVTADPSTLTPDSIGGYTLDVCVTNSTDHNIAVSCSGGYVAVDRYMIPAFLYIEVAANSQTTDTMDIENYDGEIELFGIESIRQMIIPVYVYDTDSYDTLIDTVYGTLPITDGTSAEPVSPYDRVLYEGDGITIYEDLLYGSEYGDITYELIVKNDSDSHLECYCDDTVVDGISIDPVSYGSIMPGCIGRLQIEFFSFDLEEAGITFESFTDMDTTIVFYDSNTYGTVTEASISLSFE